MADVERMLRADAEAWRTEVDDTDLTQAAPRAPRSGRSRLVAAAAGVVVVVLAVTYLATRPSANRDDAVASRHPVPTTVPTQDTKRDSLHAADADQIAFAKAHAQTIHQTDAPVGGSVESMHWRFLSLLDGGRTILLTYIKGEPCDHPLGFDIEQGTNAVILRALTAVSNGGCDASLGAAYGLVHLDSPLGNRPLLHGRVTSPGP